MSLKPEDKPKNRIFRVRNLILRKFARDLPPFAVTYLAVPNVLHLRPFKVR